MTPRFEAAFIQCLKEGVYPGPANLNQRFRADGKRFNRLNGQYTKMRLELMYLFGVPYVRGPVSWRTDYGGIEREAYPYVGTIPEWPDLEDLSSLWAKPVQGSRKHEIQDPSKPWELKHK